MIVRNNTRPITSLRVLCEAAERYDVSTFDCLDGTGIAPEELNDPDALHTTDQEIRAIENFVAIAGERAGLGWAVGRNMHVNAFGIWGFAILTSPTLRAAIQTSVDYIKLSFVIADMSLTETDKRAAIAFDVTGLPKPVRRFVFERHAAVSANFVNEVTSGNQGFELYTAATGETNDGYAKDLAKVTGLPTVVEGSAYAISFSSDLLDRPLPKSDPVSLRFCLEQCRALTESEGEILPPWSLKVRDIIVEDIATEHKIEDVCVNLGVTERTLRRRLTEEGTSFRSLYTEVRMTLAHELLEVAGLNVETVAWRVGYTETASFARAFTKQFGQTPGAVRRGS